MTKEKKPRANKYEEKVSFDGSLDDLINISAKHAERKLIKVGSTIIRGGKHFTVLGNKETDENIPDGYSLIVQDNITKDCFYSN